MPTPLEVSLASILADPARVSTAPQVVNRLSRDFYWYSPVLRRQLDGKFADVVVHPVTVQEIQDVLRYCYANDIPVTPRGAGTGNYGQEAVKKLANVHIQLLLRISLFYTVQT